MKFRLVENNLDPNAEKVIDQMPEDVQEDIEDLTDLGFGKHLCRLV